MLWIAVTWPLEQVTVACAEPVAFLMPHSMPPGMQLLGLSLPIESVTPFIVTEVVQEGTVVGGAGITTHADAAAAS